MNLGKQATRSQQLLFQTLITKRSDEEQIIIHHVIDTHYQLLLEVERRCPINGIYFERVVI